jgi:hypothetical protein
MLKTPNGVLLPVGDYKLPKQLETCSISYCCSILEHAAKWLEQGEKLAHSNNLLEENKRLSEKITKLYIENAEATEKAVEQIKKDYNTKLSKLQLRESELERQWEAKERQLRQQIEDVHIQKEQYIKSYAANLEQYKAAIKQELSQVYEDKIKLLENNINILENQKQEHQMHTSTTLQQQAEALALLAKQIEPLAKFNTGTNQEKGQLGESMLHAAIMEAATLKGAIVADTHKETAAGDFQITYNGKKYIIESKNKKVITKNDVEKFIRDCETQEAAGGIMFSLQTDKLPTNKTTKTACDEHEWYEVSSGQRKMLVRCCNPTTREDAARQTTAMLSVGDKFAATADTDAATKYKKMLDYIKKEIKKREADIVKLQKEKLELEQMAA